MKLIHINEHGEVVAGKNGVITFWEKKPAIDEHHDGDGVVGLFTVEGWCIIGLRASRMYNQYGLIVLNHFIGVWFEEA